MAYERILGLDSRITCFMNTKSENTLTVLVKLFRILHFVVATGAGSDTDSDIKTKFLELY